MRTDRTSVCARCGLRFARAERCPERGRAARDWRSTEGRAEIREQLAVFKDWRKRHPMAAALLVVGRFAAMFIGGLAALALFFAEVSALCLVLLLPVVGLMQRHFHNASLWSDGLSTDPRYKRAHSAPGRGLNALVRELPMILRRTPLPFTVRITVIGVQTKHAWILAPDHLLLTRHLIADLDNALDWLRPRIITLAAGHSAAGQRDS